jgi:hypothetical protein
MLSLAFQSPILVYDMISANCADWFGLGPISPVTVSPHVAGGAAPAGSAVNAAKTTSAGAMRSGRIRIFLQ